MNHQKSHSSLYNSATTPCQLYYEGPSVLWPMTVLFGDKSILDLGVRKLYFYFETQEPGCAERIDTKVTLLAFLKSFR